jgi:pyruvate-ferredoxin/flavodoxin oxidoreductase
MFNELFDPEVVLKWREKRTMRNNNPTMRGLVQDADIFYPIQEAANNVFAAVPRIVDDLFTELHKFTGRKYELFQYYGDPEAKYVGLRFELAS